MYREFFSRSQFGCSSNPLPASDESTALPPRPPGDAQERWATISRQQNTHTLIGHAHCAVWLAGALRSTSTFIILRSLRLVSAVPTTSRMAGQRDGDCRRLKIEPRAATGAERDRQVRVWSSRSAHCSIDLRRHQLPVLHLTAVAGCCCC